MGVKGDGQCAKKDGFADEKRKGDSVALSRTWKSSCSVNGKAIERKMDIVFTPQQH